MKLTQSHPHNRSPQLYKPVKTRMPKWLVLHCWNRAIRLSNIFIRIKNLWKTLTNFIDIDDLRTTKSTIAESSRIAKQVTVYQHVIRTIIWATKKRKDARSRGFHHKVSTTKTTPRDHPKRCPNDWYYIAEIGLPGFQRLSSKSGYFPDVGRLRRYRRWTFEESQ